MIEMVYMLAMLSKFAMVDYPSYRAAADNAADAAYTQSGARDKVNAAKAKIVTEMIRTGKDVRRRILNAGINDKAIRVILGPGAFAYKIYKDQEYTHVLSNTVIFGGIPYIKVGLSGFVPAYTAGGINWTWHF